MSAANIESWQHIHGLRQNLLNEMGLRRGAFGQGYHDPTFSPANYIQRMFEKRPMLTRLHQRLREQIPEANTIRVRFEKDGGLLILVTGRTAAGDETYYHFNIDNIYNFVVPPISEYNNFKNRRNEGRYLPIREIVYRTLREVIQDEQAAVLGEIYEAETGQSGARNRGPVGHIMRFMGGSRRRRTKKSRKYRR
jgi:hypothetical protein